MTPAALIVAATHLCRTFGGEEAAVDALVDVSVESPEGGFTAIMGPSGSGTSTPGPGGSLTSARRWARDGRGVELELGGLVAAGEQCPSARLR